MSQLTSEGYQYSSLTALSILGEEPAEALAKACFDADKLTKSDLFRLDSLYTQLLQTIDRVINLSERGSFYGRDYWKPIAKAQFDTIFRTQLGRNFWSSFGENWRTEIKEFGDSLLSKSSEPSCASRYSQWGDANSGKR
jgi:hypothetical protein